MYTVIVRVAAPFMPTLRQIDNVVSVRDDGLGGFDEVYCRQGSLGRFEAKHLLPQLLAAAGRLTKYGA